jgi:hypothetical protein
MNRGKATSLVIVISTVLAGAYAALRVAAPENSSQISVTDTATVTATYEGCAFVWAYREQPENSAIFNVAVRELFPLGSGRARAFGEDCIYADGRSEFSTKETDFYVYLPVADLADEETLGNQITEIMTIVMNKFPSDTLPGGHNGFVEFYFEQSGEDYFIIRVPIQEYKRVGIGKTGAELFKMFHEGQ